MTEEEFKRYESGVSIKNEISVIQYKINEINFILERKSYTDCLRVIDELSRYLDSDILQEAAAKQLLRYEMKKAELQKEFDRL